MDVEKGWYIYCTYVYIDVCSVHFRLWLRRLHLSAFYGSTPKLLFIGPNLIVSVNNFSEAGRIVREDTRSNQRKR